MSKCANCTNEAVFEVRDRGVSAVDYCAVCLPPHMVSRAQAGHFAPAKTVVEEVVEEVVAEEPVVAEAPVAPKPKAKKATKASS